MMQPGARDLCAVSRTDLKRAADLAQSYRLHYNVYVELHRCFGELAHALCGVVRFAAAASIPALYFR